MTESHKGSPAGTGRDPDAGAAAHAALRRCDRRGEIRRPRHGRRGGRPRFRPRHGAARTVGREPGRGARRRPADRRHAEEARHRSRSSRAACASPTRRRSRSSRWCWPARSTSRSSASSMPRAAGRSASAARTATWSPPSSSSGTRRCRRADDEADVDLGFVGEPAQGRHHGARPGARPRADPGPGAGRAGRATARPTTSTPTPSRAPSPARSKAKRLLFLTDVPGVLDKNKQLIKELQVDEIRGLIADGTITGGMIPKVETCIYALEQGVEGVVILDGKVPACGAGRTADRPRRRHADHPVSDATSSRPARG